MSLPSEVTLEIAPTPPITNPTVYFCSQYDTEKGVFTGENVYCTECAQFVRENVKGAQVILRSPVDPDDGETCLLCRAKQGEKRSERLQQAKPGDSRAKTRLRERVNQLKG